VVDQQALQVLALLLDLAAELDLLVAKEELLLVVQAVDQQVLQELAVLKVQAVELVQQAVNEYEH